MINVGVDVNFRDKDEMFFILVCKVGYVKVVDELIKVGVDIILVDKKKILLMIVFDYGYL